MKTTLRLLGVIVVLFSIVSSAAAQQLGAPRPGMIVTTPPIGGGGSGTPTPLPVKETGIAVTVLDYNSRPVENATVVVALERYDWQSGTMVPDPTTAKEFGPCESGKETDCLKKDGKGTLINASLPQSGDQQNQWRTLNIRGKARGYFHWVTEAVRVGLDGSTLVQAQPVWMQESGFTTSDTKMWRVSDRVMAVKFWVRQNWEEQVRVDFSFKGTAWTVPQVAYGTTSTTVIVGPGSDNQGVPVEIHFWIPQNQTAQFGGTVTVETQIRSMWEAEYVKGTIPEAYLKLPPVNNGKG